MAEPSRSDAIAIIGMAGRFPGAEDLDGFWRNIVNGVEVLETFNDEDIHASGVDPTKSAHPNYVRKGTVLQGADLFDASFFGIPPREAQLMDPQQRLFLECAWEALEHGGYAGNAEGRAVGVYAGAGMNTYFIHQILGNAPLAVSAGGYQLMLANDKDFLATRVSYKLDLRGPSLTVQTACSTSLVAVVTACRALQRGECDLALAGGVSIGFPQRSGYLFEEGMILSPDGHCRPFDEAARGTRAGSGAGIVLLKRLSDALDDRDTIHAVILGASINNDGAGKAGFTAPSIAGQLEVIATAQALAGVDPRSIGYIETHGTGTPLGDPIEIAALSQAFRASTQDVGFCRIGSLKANLGHLDTAAGVAGLIKTVLSLEHRQIAPLVNFKKPNPQLALDQSPFVASAEASPWEPPAASPRRAGVSSFGIGGTNAHVVLEEAPSVPARAPASGPHLLLLSAKTASALDRTTQQLADHLENHREQPLCDVAWTLSVGRGVFRERRAVVARDAAHAVELLRTPQRPFVLTATYDGGPRPVAFLFSGQGSQHPTMGADLYQAWPAYRDAIDRSAELLTPHLGRDIRPLMFESDEGGTINETRFSQPALFAMEYALASLWASWGVRPTAMLGHSIGEYVAAHLAGVMSLEDALRVVAARGELMQQQQPGKMASVQLAPHELERWLSGGVELAAINAPGLCTVAGPSSAIDALLEQLAGAGVQCTGLHTSHAFHSAMMEPVLEPFQALLASVSLSPPQVPYVSNLTGDWITEQQATSPQYYAQHLRKPVRFEAGVRTLCADPALLLLEVGPGTVLSSLSRATLGQSAAQRVVASSPHPRDARSAKEVLLEGCGRLWLSGVLLDWTRMYGDLTPFRVPLPTYPFERQRFWVDAVTSQPVTALHQSQPLSLDDWFYSPTWLRDDSLGGRPATLSDSWLVFATPGTLGDVVAERIARAGAEPVVVLLGERFEVVEGRYQVRPGSVEDLARVFQGLTNAGKAVRGALYLWSSVFAEQGVWSMPVEPSMLYYHALVSLGEALESLVSAHPIRVIVVTRGAESVLDEPVSNHHSALVTGPVISLPTEVPGLRMRAVDFLVEGVSDVQLADALVQEAAHEDGEGLVARRSGRRWIRRFERLRLSAGELGPSPLRQAGVYLITGGLGGIGLTLAHWLASQVSARLVLTARTPLPEREAWDSWLAQHEADERNSLAIRAIQEIEAAGSEVLVTAADVTDEAAMRQTIDAARARFGELHGVLHAAGDPGKGALAFRKQAEDVDRVLAPKLDGLSVLVKLLGDSDLDFVALFSSFNSLVGAPGLCDYAAANAALAAFVDSKHRPIAWKQVVALDWGPWRDVGMAARLMVPGAQREARAAFLKSAIAPALGSEAFGRAITSGMHRLFIVPFDPGDALQLAKELSGGSEQDITALPASRRHEAPKQSRPDLSTIYEQPKTNTERRLAAIWTELLGIEQVGVHDDFFELGGHSLLATRVLARIDQATGVRLTLRDAFEAPTISRLAALIDAAHGSPSESEPEGDREEIEF